MIEESYVRTRLNIRSALRQFEVFPKEHRLTLWKTILQLPGNKERYLQLRRRRHEVEYVGTVASPDEYKTLRNVLRCFMVHSPPLRHCSYLNDFAKPFESVCLGNELAFFEIVLSILLNQCRSWFDDVRRPPHTVCIQLDIILLKHQPDLYKHLVSNGIRSENYAWQWMQSAFSTVVDQSEWPHLWDHILCNKPTFFDFIPAAICKLLSQRLLEASTTEELLEILKTPSSFDHTSVAREAYKIRDETPEQYHPRETRQDFVRLPTGIYPTLCPTEKVSSITKLPLDIEQLLQQVKTTAVEADTLLQRGFQLRTEHLTNI